MCARLVVVSVLVSVLAGAADATQYAFYRRLREHSEGGAGEGGRSGRRLFGGRAAALDEWGAVCALVDRYWTARCSGAVLTPRWALTAAHCVTPRLAYVQYNTRHPAGASEDGDAAPVHYLYRHPGYRVVEADEGRGMDVTLLHHDVGLVRTRHDMRLASPPPLPQLDAMQLYDPNDLVDRPVDVLGFGRTESTTVGERLYVTRLLLARCERGAWLHCVCGSAGGEGRGVCAGDSGGPVVYRGVQVAVTSMGPLECGAADGVSTGAPLTSVFTALRRYVPLLNATVLETDSALRMSRVAGAAPRAPARPRLLPLAGAGAALCIAPRALLSGN